MSQTLHQSDEIGVNCSAKISYRISKIILKKEENLNSYRWAHTPQYFITSSTYEMRSAIANILTEFSRLAAAVLSYIQS